MIWFVVYWLIAGLIFYNVPLSNPERGFIVFIGSIILGGFLVPYGLIIRMANKINTW